MLFRGSAATTRAHQEEAIRRRKSGRNSLRADRHRRRTGQAGREDFAKFCLSGCSAQECRDRRSLRGSRAAALPSGCDALRHILLGIIWRIAGGRFAAPLHRVALPRARRSLRDPRKERWSLKLTRHNGRAGKHGTYNPKHNDRSFEIANSLPHDAV